MNTGRLCLIGGLISIGFAISAQPEAAPPREEKAKVRTLVGKEAEAFLRMDPARPVIIIGIDDKPVAVLLATSQQELRSVQKSLFVDADPPYCDTSKPVGCCDPKRGSMLLNTEEGWLDYGETCTIPTDDQVKAIIATPEEQPVAAFGDFSSEPSAKAPAVSPLDRDAGDVLSSRFGSIFEHVVLPRRNGAPRLLSQPAGLSTGDLDPPHGATPRTPLLRLAAASADPGSPILAQAGSCRPVSECNRNGPDSRCHHGDHWWYTRSGGTWCRTPVPCTHRY